MVCTPSLVALLAGSDQVLALFLNVDRVVMALFPNLDLVVIALFLVAEAPAGGQISASWVGWLVGLVVGIQS